MTRKTILTAAAALALLTLCQASVTLACPLHRNKLLAVEGYYPGLAPGLTTLVNQMIRLESSGAAADVRIEVDRPPSEVGRWLPARDWPVLSIHTAVLPTGKVLQYSYPYLSSGSAARVYNPANSSFQNVNWSQDLFCSGHAFLPDGKLLVTGGNDPGLCDTRGRAATHLFDPFTNQWSPAGEMADARWYPTNVSLGDGRVMILSGLDHGCNINQQMEIYTPGEGMRIVPEGRRSIELYPRVHLLSDGRVAHVGPERVTHAFDLVRGRWDQIASTQHLQPRFEGTSFLVPGRPDTIMLCGGFPDYDKRPTRTCEQIDFSRGTPRWRFVAPYNEARAHANVVLLPDGSVLAVGGGTRGLYDNPVLNAELYDPGRDSWTLLPPQEYGRMYHSTAILLPDGRVLSGGQDDDELDDGIINGHFGEVYEPPYLFRGRRPSMRKAPKRVAYGDAFTVKAPKARAIESVVLISLAAQTHSVNTPQRLVELEFASTGKKKLEAIAPEHGNLAPPGYYMLFIVDGDGVPSTAKFVRLVG